MIFKIQAYLHLGKKVRYPQTEMPDIIGTLYAINQNGKCQIQPQGIWTSYKNLRKEAK